MYRAARNSRAIGLVRAAEADHRPAHADHRPAHANHRPQGRALASKGYSVHSSSHSRVQCACDPHSAHGTASKSTPSSSAASVMSSSVMRSHVVAGGVAAVLLVCACVLMHPRFTQTTRNDKRPNAISQPWPRARVDYAARRPAHANLRPLAVRNLT